MRTRARFAARTPRRVGCRGSAPATASSVAPLRVVIERKTSSPARTSERRSARVAGRASLLACVREAEDEHGCAPLHIAAQDGHSDTVKVLASLHADVNQARYCAANL